MKGKDAEEGECLEHFPSGRMVNNHVTVIRVDGVLPKDVDSQQVKDDTHGKG